jgi:GNAT superfamily N-acetyltransferase
MNLKFTDTENYKAGLIFDLLSQSYHDLLQGDSDFRKSEVPEWREFDTEVFNTPDKFRRCVFFSWLGDDLVGFGSFNPSLKPEFGIIGHHCILPRFRGRGLGKQQLQEILRRFREIGIRLAKVSTGDSSFFIPAQRTYIACGFREVRRTPWQRNPQQIMIHYEMKIGQAEACDA